MPVVKDARGGLRYGRLTEFSYREHPSDFLSPDEFAGRVAVARSRVLDIVRFTETPLSGKGLCHEVCGLTADMESLVDYVDECDSRRANNVRKAKKWYRHGLQPNRSLPRSPQHRARRRSALFGGVDLPEGYLEDTYDPLITQDERDGFVDLMRWLVIRDAIAAMIEQHELEWMNGVWYVKVSTLDAHRSGKKKKANRVKQDDRSFHGRPNRDRGKIAA